ncbi:mannitol dehydrogenase family protein [Oricola thermophila]|uniref:Mannitol dehydrogenase family protein n=1 Tax=Oricola thermophila TaxID=2742145 RepID=A0A6N1VDV4_9HYPH|nr:mannitol dehydrogenase family protein [Oricola thermophila]QKV19161.1 mannitol dehydrogenase family protein [Oricola thermophila]
MTIKLSLAAMRSLPARVAKPSYGRADLSAGIVHIGVGNFHRAHQAMYLHRLFESGRDRDWAIVGAGVKSYDASMRDRLKEQDWLTTVVELDPEGFSATVCGSMVDFAEVDPAVLIETMARPEIRIVSLTVTEGGYYVDAKTGGFDASHPEIVADRDNPDDPKTVFGILIAALLRRRAAGVPPFTVMSCDNLPENGHVARNAVLGLAQGRPDDTHDWIADNVAFPCGMVDCITPATGRREIALVAEKFDIEDAAPVICEPFRQWVLEDNFPQGRPALETVGVEFVDDVAPYELMKLRILNGGHATIAYPAGLLGIHFVHEAMRNPLVTGFLEKLEFTEIIPTVPDIPGTSREAYYEKIVERFSNEAVGDTIPRLCLDGSNRQPKFILPTITARLDAGQPVDGLALEVALWCRYCAGTDESGNVITVEDIAAGRLKRNALAARTDPSAWLSMHDIFGDLGRHPVFAAAFASALSSLWKDGVGATLAAYIG